MRTIRSTMKLILRELHAKYGYQRAQEVGEFLSNMELALHADDIETAIKELSKAIDHVKELPNSKRTSSFARLLMCRAILRLRSGT